jgi:hypothetical protein
VNGGKKPEHRPDFVICAGPEGECQLDEHIDASPLS